MFSAKYFIYDGISSETYGLIMADFDDSTVLETAAFSPVLNVAKSSTSKRFIHHGVDYESAPQHQFSIISEKALTPTVRREVLSWLIGRNEYKQLKILQSDLEAYTYNCVFTDTEIIFINGICHGFRITANFDSPYARGTPIIATASTGTSTININNTSDIKDDYVYPTIQFTGSNIKITNNTDGGRIFSFSGLSAGEQIIVDNEMRYVSSNLSIGRLGNFNKNWLRLKRGINSLTVVASGSVTITCPNYVMIGF